MLDIEKPVSVDTVRFSAESTESLNKAARVLGGGSVGSRTGAQYWVKRVAELDARTLLSESGSDVAHEIGKSLVGHLSPEIAKLYADGFDRGISVGPLPEDMVVISDTMLIRKEELAV
jgi:hypothetical protein